MIRLKELRQKCGMTQADLGKMLKVSASAIGMYEHGRREPDLALLNKIADCFSVTLDFLFDRTQPANMSIVNAPTNENFSKEERGVIQKYRALSKSGKEIINGTLNVVYLQEQQRENHAYRKKAIS